MGTDFDISFVTVPIDLIVLPLCVIPDCGDQQINTLLFYQKEIARYILHCSMV